MDPKVAVEQTTVLKVCNKTYKNVFCYQLFYEMLNLKQLSNTIIEIAPV